MSNNFADLFEHAVDAMPERIAVIAEGRAVDFRELDKRANRLAHHLASVGIGVGDHVGYHLHNSAELVEVLVACLKIRAVPVNINYRYTAAELHYVYDNADLRAVVHHRRYSRAVAAVLPQIPLITHTMVVEDGSSEDGGGSTRYEEALAGQSDARDFGPRSGDDVFMTYTGGTTGRPKGVVWRQEDLWRVLGGGIDFYTGEPVADEYTQSGVGAAAQPSRWFVLLPLIHVGGLMTTFSALWSGNTVVLEPGFDARRVWEVVVRDEVVVLSIAGDAMAIPLIDAYRADPVPARLGMIASGAALLSQSVKNQLLELFPTTMLSDSVGSSETGFGGMGIAEKTDAHGRGPRIRVGRGAVVVDDDGVPVEVGGEGWLAKTGAVPIGYYKDPERTAQLFKIVDGARVVVTGDRAIAEPDGFVTLLGRGNMVINTGGEKVYVEEVEGVLKAHDHIYDAVVVAIPHPRWGQTVVAVVTAAGRGPVDFVSLEAHGRTHLAGYKVPRSIWVVDAIARTPSGKPDYRLARAHVEQHRPDYDSAAARPTRGLQPLGDVR